MANASTPESVAAARAAVEANLQRNSEEAHAARRAHELFLMKRNQIITTAARSYKTELARRIADLTDAPGTTSILETTIENVFRLTQFVDVYARAKESIDNGPEEIEACIERFRRQLAFAIEQPQAFDAVKALSRAYYIQARWVFLGECSAEMAERLSTLDPR